MSTICCIHYGGNTSNSKQKRWERLLLNREKENPVTFISRQVDFYKKILLFPCFMYDDKHTNCSQNCPYALVTYNFG